MEGARSRGKRVSKRRSKTSLTPGIFILYIYIYIYSSTSMVPGAGLLGETLRTYSLPFLRNASRLLLLQNPARRLPLLPMSLPGLLPHYHSQNSR